jgi:hypothetical protein
MPHRRFRQRPIVPAPRPSLLLLRPQVLQQLNGPAGCLAQCGLGRDGAAALGAALAANTALTSLDLRDNDLDAVVGRRPGPAPNHCTPACSVSQPLVRGSCADIVINETSSQ